MWRAIAPNTFASIAVAVSAVLQLVLLDAFPPFVDEAVYVRWAVRLAESPSADTLWLSTHEDWQTPAFIWAVAVAYSWLDDPILTGRLIASLSGVLTVALVYQAGSRLIGAWPATIAAAVIAASPALVFTNRLALTDPPVVALTALIWGLSIPATRGHVPSALGAGIAGSARPVDQAHRRSSPDDSTCWNPARQPGHSQAPGHHAGILHRPAERRVHRLPAGPQVCEDV